MVLVLMPTEALASRGEAVAQWDATVNHTKKPAAPAGRMMMGASDDPVYYAFDALVGPEVTQAFQGTSAYPVCDGMLAFVQDRNPFETVEMSFTPSANGSGVYNVTYLYAAPEVLPREGVYLEFLFDQGPLTQLPTVTRISGAIDVTREEYYDDDYAAVAGGDDIYWSSYWWYEFDALELGEELSATFEAQIPKSDTENVVRTINLTVRRVPMPPADFAKLLGSRADLYDANRYFISDRYPVEIRRGVMLSDNEGWLMDSDAVLDGTVNGHRAFAVKASSYVYFALAFELSDGYTAIYWAAYDPDGTPYPLNAYRDEHVVGNYVLVDEQYEYQGVRSEIGAYVDVYGSPTSLLLVAYNSQGDYLPIVLSVMDVNDEDPLTLPTWQSAWDAVLAGYSGGENDDDSYDDSDADERAAEAAAERAFWQELVAKAEEAVATAADGVKPVHTLDAARYETLPYWVVDVLAGQNTLLKLTYLDAEGNRQTVDIDCTKVVKTEPNRVFYRLYDFVSLYAAQA
jgi:hypothetical protein